MTQSDLHKVSGRISALVSCFAVISFLLVAAPVMAQANLQHLPTQHVRDVVKNGTAKLIGAFPASQQMQLAIMLRLRNQAELDDLLQQLYEPTSPVFRQFLSVAQFTERFGPTVADYQAVVDWAVANGFTIGKTPANRLLVPVTGTVAQINRAFNISMNIYQHPTENRRFFAPDREPTIELDEPIWHIAGLDDYSIPRPALTRASGSPAQATGSGPGGLFLPGDMRVVYYGGATLTGSGQIIGLMEFGGFNMNDVALTFGNSNQATWSTTGTAGDYVLHYTTNGTQYNIPVNTVPVDNFQPGSDTGDLGEQALDIAQSIGMAPGVSQVRVYTAPNNFIQSGGYDYPANNDDYTIFNDMATDSGNLPHQISISWNWAPEDFQSNDNIIAELESQGQNIFAASGDYDSWPNGDYYYPEEHPGLTSVGGTVLTTNGAGGSRNTEIAWGGANTSCIPGTGSGGGVSPHGYAIPSYQQLDGVINSSNEGSTTKRNAPDVALQADCANYYCDMGSCSIAEGGTSYAAPRWAGFMALVNQQAVSDGKAPTGGIGFINPTVYSIGVGSNYNSDFFDVTSGDNFDSSNPNLFPAVTGYDLVTGWGTPNGQNLISDLEGTGGPLSAATPYESNVTVNLNGMPPTSIDYLITFQDATPGATIHYQVNICNSPYAWSTTTPGSQVDFYNPCPSITPYGTMYATAPGYLQSSSTSMSF